ncbi:MAG: glycosyltransferase [Candidatus Tritonobacter lacicola]|nr:glycosyltransferase [Candidatus Tritonobacter lacicola]
MKISLYIPCRNAEKFISGCLDSVLAQSLEPCEIIVVNDRSTDLTVEIAKKFPVKVIDLPSHPGLAAARNAAVKTARCEYIASVDADCVAEPAWLEKLMNNLREDGVAGAGGRLVEKHRERLADRWRAAHMRQDWGEERIINPPFLFGCNTLFRKSALEDAGLYDPMFRSNGEDVDISSRLKEKGYELIYEPSALIYHLKKDTPLSVLRADWNWGYISTGEREKFQSPANIVYHNFTNAKYRFLKDVSAGRRGLIPLDILLFFLHTYWDIAHARKLGLSRACFRGEKSRIRALNEFRAHLAVLSEKRFLENPDEVGAKSNARKNTLRSNTKP